MKVLNVDLTDKEKPIVEVETRPKTFLTKQKIKKYKATGNYVADYYRWVEMPNMELVGDALSSQLDEWLRQAK